MDKICLDTDFLVDFLRKKPEAERFVKDKENAASLATTYVNLFELYKGAYNSEKMKQNISSIEILKKRLIILNLSDNSVEMAAKISTQLKQDGALIDIRDLFIGTIAASNGFAIKTNNARHFNKIPELNLA